jgi:hypothetical protein
VQDNPSPETIGALANALLRDSDPKSARAKFETRMAASALDLVKRAAELAPGYDAKELIRLTALLDERGNLEALNRRLCERIRDGSLSLASPGVAAHVRATTMEKLAIDQPSYAAYRRALEQTGE